MSVSSAVAYMGGGNVNEERPKCPWPYFGGKSKVAALVWSRLGDVDNFVEPFCGSAAVLLARPQPFGGVETINDANGYVANAWRAIRYDPDAVVEWCDAPVSELDLHAEHRWLVGIDPPSPWTDTPYLHAMAGPGEWATARRLFRERLRQDPDYFDARVAGQWIHGACCWIGGGWCDVGGGCGPAGGSGERHPSAPSGLQGVHSKGETALQEKRPRAHSESTAGGGSLPGVHSGTADQQRRPVISAPHSEDGLGVHGVGELSERMPRLAGHERQPGQGVCNDKTVRAQGRPQLADAYDIGRGVHASHDVHLSEQRPGLTEMAGAVTPAMMGQDVGPVVGTCDARRAWLLGWLRRLQDRLRLVRVCCGHWLRVCDSPSVTTRLGTTGLFLDPPYPLRSKSGKKSRSGGLYQGDEARALDDLRDEILAYCLERGRDRQMRIVLACYEGDGYEPLTAEGWECVSWEAGGGYANQRGKKADNARRERLYFSPYCQREAGLFDHLEAAA